MKKNMALSKVVHCKKASYDVYIGRPSEFGNPYVIGKDGSRREVIEKYEKRLRKLLKTDPKFEERLMSLKGKVLGCWCKPLDCHGDIIVKVIDELSSKYEDTL